MLNPKQMQELMKKMNIKQEELNAKKVVIELEEGKIVIEKPVVVALKVKGKTSYQIVGEERFEESLNEEDISLIMKETNVSREKAVEALKKAEGRVADAILSIMEEKEGES